MRCSPTASATAKRDRRSAARFDLLQGDHVCRPIADHRSDAVQIEIRVQVEGAVNVPGHDADLAGHVLARQPGHQELHAEVHRDPGSDRRPSSSDIRPRCALRQIAICAPMPPSRDAGPMPSAVPIRKSARRNGWPPPVHSDRKLLTGTIRTRAMATTPLSTTAALHNRKAATEQRLQPLVAEKAALIHWSKTKKANSRARLHRR